MKLLVSRFHEQEQINELELVVAMQKTQEIYEHFLKMKLTSSAEATEIATVQGFPAEIPDTEDVEKIEQHSRVSAKIESVEPEKAPVKKKVEAVRTERKPKEKRREERKKPVEATKAAILAEKFSSSDLNHVNETLAQPNQDLSSKLKTAPLASIVSGIGLNDRFLFLRELFNGESSLYNSTVKQLDAASSLEEALDFISRNFDWDDKNESVKKFLDLVQRRHHS